MAFQLDAIVPWGRSFDEYVAMFDLSARDLNGSILGCGDGPAAFNCELTQRGGRVTSVDPLYSFDAGKIEQRIDATFAQILAETTKNKHEFVWKSIPSIEALGRVRMEAMQTFLADYDGGQNERRYQSGSLPALPFATRQFDLALCSHLLFLYSEQLDLKFHIASIREMCRVASEARIFPLLQLGGTTAPHLQSFLDLFRADGYEVDIITVPYEFQRSGNQMLRVRNAEDARERKH